jgi:hypothetical protein
MAITFVGAGAYSEGTTAAAPALPAGTQQNDILLLVCGSSGHDTLACDGYAKKAEYQAGGEAMNLVVPLEMLEYGLRSDTGVLTSNRARMKLDPADYDGATYYFEIVATTKAGTESVDVELYDVTNASVKATIRPGASKTYERFRSAAFTPAAGGNTYTIRIDATTAASDLVVLTARIIVVQAGATKTRLQYQLGSHQYSGTATDSGGSFDELSSATYGQTYAERYYNLPIDKTKLATIAAGTPWTLECVFNSGHGTSTASIGLFDRTDDALVTGAEVTLAGETPMMASIDFTDNATNFDDGHVYEARMKTSAANTCYLYAARLYVRLTSLSKAVVYSRIARLYTANTFADSMPFQRQYYDVDQWSPGATWYLEACGQDASATPAALVYCREADGDTGTGSTTLAPSITMTAAQSTPTRTAITLTDEKRYMGRRVASTGNASFAGVYLVTEVTASASGAAPQVTVFWKRHTGSESTPTVTGASDSIVALIHAFRGIDTGADPWDAYDAGQNDGVNVVAELPALTTSTDGALVVGAFATADNNSWRDSEYGNLSTDLRQFSSRQTLLGSDSSFAFVAGLLAIAGDVGTITAEKTSSALDELYVATVGALKAATVASGFHLNFACMVADEGATELLQPDITGYAFGGSEIGDYFALVGTDFGSDGQVLFGTTPAVITLWSDTQVRMTIPNVPTAGTYTVTIAPYGDYYTDSVTFIVTATEVPVPSITSITPLAGIVGSAVTISGENLGASGGTVLFGSTTATQLSHSATEIVATVPTLALGAYFVQVLQTGLNTATSPLAFTVTDTPPVDAASANPFFDGTAVVTIGGLDVTADLLPGLTWSNTNPGGYGDASMRLSGTDPATTYDAAGLVRKGAKVRITHGSSSRILFEGEVTNDLSRPVLDGGDLYYDVTAAGLWWKAGLRGDFRRTWGDGDPSRWFEMSSGGVFEVDVDGKLDIRLPAGQTAKNGAAKSLYYWLDDGMGSAADDIGYFIGLVGGRVLDKDSAAWHAELLSSDSPWGTWTVEESWDNETVSDGTPLLVTMASEGVKALRLKLYVDTAASTGTTADRYIRLSSFSVLGADFTTGWNDLTTAGTPTRIRADAAHGLKTGDRIFINGFGTTPDISGWRTVTVIDADEFTIPITTTIGTSDTFQWFVGPRIDAVLADIAVTDNLATDSDVQSGGIGNVNWSFNVRPHMSRAEAIEQVAAMHSSPLSYGFWDDATFFCHENPYANARVYLIDSTAPGIDAEVFRATEESPTHVKLLYGFRDVVGGSEIYPEGTVLSVYRPSEPYWDDAAYVLDVWDEWSDVLLETAQAEAIGDQILSWISANQYEGTVTIATPTVTDTSAGAGLQAERNTAYIRAGDFLVDLSLAETALWRVTSMEMDVDSGVATLGIGETRAEFVARMVPRRPRKVIGKKRVNGKWVKIWGDA